MERNRAVAYIRVSKDVEEQKTSLENQRSQFIQYLKENNMSYAGIYVDVETGVNEGREQLKQMLEDGKEKKYDIIIAKEISRICRNAKLGYEIKNLTDTKNIRLLTMDGKIDTHDAEKNALFGLHLWIAESEAETVSRRIKASIKTRMKKGNFIGSFAPYGYIKKNHQLHIRKDNTPDVVKEIFDLFLQGWGQDKIANHLTRQGIPTPAEVAGKKNAGKYWQGSTIYLILKNQAYIGNLIQGKEATINAVNHDRRKIPQSEQIVIEKKHEPIVDIATFNQVQEMIKRKNRKGKGKIKQQKHLFTNHLFCEDCGKSLWYRKNQKGYVCGSYSKHGKIACSSHLVREDVVVETILNDLKRFAKNLDTDKIQAKLSKQHLKKSTNIRTIDKINNEISSIKKKKLLLLDNLLDETVSKEDYAVKNNQFDNTIEDLENEILTIKDTASSKFDFDTDTIKAIVEKFLSFDNITNEMINQLIDKIVVSEDNSINIVYTFQALNL